MNNLSTNSEAGKEPDATSSLLSGGELSVERLPMLQVLFEQVCESMVQQFSNLSSASMEIALERVWTGDIHEADVSDEQHIIIQLETGEDKPCAYFVLDRPSLYLLIECMLGASGNERPYLEKHAFTAMEFMFAKTIASQASQAFCRVFSDIIEISMSVKSAVKGSEIDLLSVSDDVFLTSNIALDVFNRSGSMNILIPQGILAPVKNRFVNSDNQDIDSEDLPWMEHLKTQFQHTAMECTATLDGGKITLGDVAQMKVGEILELGIPADSPVRLSSNEEDLFWCELGQADGAFTLKIKDPASAKKDFLDVMLEGRNLSDSTTN